MLGRVVAGLVLLRKEARRMRVLEVGGGIEVVGRLVIIISEGAVVEVVAAEACRGEVLADAEEVAIVALMLMWARVMEAGVWSIEPAD